ncbi:hypothetical protein HMPREF9406_0056 [Clostridium sp. HGF2]|nr:hypothetical protein HMPREF9406_0056 [Clostridium sp. HGF2]EQJ60117.1 hypothetical protein QSI_1302 [Clostridioides difficile P28]
MLFVILESFGTTNSREIEKHAKSYLIKQRKRVFRIAFKN